MDPQETDTMVQTTEEPAVMPVAETTEATATEISGTDGTAPQPSTDGRHWYVIHTYSGYENKVKKNLEHRIVTLDMGDRIFRVEVPTVEEIEIRSGQRHP